MVKIYTNALIRFLLATLHMDSLRDKVSKGDVRRALTILPTGSNAYYQVYHESLVRIQNQTDNLLARRALMWTVCTKRLLTIEGLQHDLAITRETKKFDEDNMPEVDLIIEVCSGLVTFDEKSKVLRLVHFTAQECFLRKWKDWFGNAHSEIAWVCASYLSLDLFRPGKIKRCQKVNRHLFMTMPPHIGNITRTLGSLTMSSRRNCLKIHLLSSVFKAHSIAFDP